MNNISDKLVIVLILITIIFVFGLIFSVKSPERKVIDSPIMWKDDYSNITIFKRPIINSVDRVIWIKFCIINLIYKVSLRNLKHINMNFNQLNIWSLTYIVQKNWR